MATNVICGDILVSIHLWPVANLETQSRIMSGTIWRNLGFDYQRIFYKSRINPRLICDQKRVVDLNM